jgi:hypothetical protein
MELQAVVASDAEQRMGLQFCASWRIFRVKSYVEISYKDFISCAT